MDVREQSADAVFLHMESVFYSSEHLTDGYVPERRIIRLAGAEPNDAKLLVNFGLWHRPGHDCLACPDDIPEGHIYVHDYPKHNQTKADVEKRKAAGKKGAHARWAKRKAQEQEDANDMRTAIPEAMPIAYESHTDRNALSYANGMDDPPF